jgi:glycosyltransferase involved in cell wall biosynthesis
LKIAFMGIRGIPASYSGFETFVDQIAPRLAAKGCDVTVFNRSNFMKERFDTYQGVKMVYCGSVPSKHFDTISHSFASLLKSFGTRFDIVYFCGVGNSPLAFLPRLKGAKVILNIDGEDWARGKWGRVARTYLRVSELIACRTANVLIADSRIIEKRYRELYRKDTVFIPYGSNIQRNEGDEALRKFGLEKRGYILFAGRLVPENNAHLLIKAYAALETEKKLVILGDAPWSDDYKAELKALANGNVVFTGYQFGADYAQLSSHAYLYAMVSGVDGTRPVLLDQMGFGNAVLVRNSSANSETAGAAGLFFDQADEYADLVRQLKLLLADPARVAEFRVKSVQRVREAYSWDRITDDYLELFRKTLGRGESAK